MLHCIMRTLLMNKTLKGEVKVKIKVAYFFLDTVTLRCLLTLVVIH